MILQHHTTAKKLFEKIKIGKQNAVKTRLIDWLIRREVTCKSEKKIPNARTGNCGSLDTRWAKRENQIRISRTEKEQKPK